MELTSKNVDQVFKDCLYQSGEDTSKHIEAEGIMCSVGFHPNRLTNHKKDIQTMLQCLPDNFRQTKGSGWSFLMACTDNKGIQWTDLHQRMDQLFQLGIGLGLARWQMPRYLWSTLPGGMPYVIVLDKE